MRALAAIVARLAVWPRTLGAVLLAAWMALIWLLSAQPPTNLTQGSQAGAWVMNLAHAPEYGALALWLAMLARSRSGALAPTPRAVFWMLAFVAVHGLADELHQSIVPGRDASVLDIVTDLAGATSVLALLRALQGPSPDRAGARRTIVLGAGACAAAATLATFVPSWFPEASWL